MLKVSFEINEADISNIPFTQAKNLNIAPVMIQASPERLKSSAQGVVYEVGRYNVNQINIAATLKAHNTTLAALQHMKTKRGSWQYAVKLAARHQGTKRA